MASLPKPLELTPPTILETGRPAATPETERWPAAWARPGFRLRLGLVLLLLLGLLPVVPGFYHFIQARPGQRLADPLLALLPVHDVSVPTFALIYGAIAGTLVYLLPRPQRLLQALWAYYFLQLLRMLTLWLLPLEPPTTLVLLHDPVMDRIFEVTTQPIVRDLFFSGHTATMVLLTLVGRGQRWRWVLGLMSVAVGLLVLVQRVHYSYDVLAAPLFAWLAYWLAGRVTKQQSAVR
ncbi:phosphatase PAP2-related protein [Hymenobacter sp. M29]|uniref:Phosphatase PAP2-related protein n=1 Tax=Hymenobacter mellowenesis TaxID=3063995 RepID=A0ABT9A5J8_9BACT|nr:phosphatase PAP2-related protein [Hymenobacter sp. M29]MDO7845115.1 phosphatase PAP2-related protein [Hymenobacter sp. M29]